MAYLIPKAVITKSRSELQVLFFFFVNGTIATPRIKLELGFRLRHAKKVRAVGELLSRNPSTKLVEAVITRFAVDFKSAPKKTFGQGG